MSNFPWFMDLTFQVPLQYCSLQHQIFLSSPNTLTTKCCVCFGPAASFIQGPSVILLYSFPVAYWTPSDPGDSSFGVIPFWPFIQFVRFSQQVYWGSLPFPSPVDHVLSELSAMTYPSTALHNMVHSFAELHKPLHLEGVINHMKRQKGMTPEGKPLRSEGVQYTTGEEWKAITNSSRRNEASVPKQKWCWVVENS